MIAKRHDLGTKSILAVCDKEHLGKSFEEGNLFFEVREKFYGGEEIEREQLIELIKEADSVNFFGNKCIEIAIKEGLISESNVIIISGIKHAQAYVI